MRQNKSLRSNGVHRELSLRKIMTQHYGTNFCINFTSLARFAASFVQKRNGFKCTQMERNAPKHEFRFQWCGSAAFVVTRHRGMNFCINCTSLARFASSLCSSIMVPNAPKRKETHENMSLGSNCVDRERRFWEILTRLCGTNSCINCTSSPICTEFRAVAKRFQMHPNWKKCTKKWV